MKKLLKIVVAIVVVLILIAVAVPMFISAEVLKKEVVAQASAATGRTVTINGKASLKLFPTIAVSVEDVTIGNPAGFTTPFLLHAKTLATGAALMPLLHGALEVTGVTVDGADINLEQNAAGAKNWEFAKEKAAASANKNAAQAASGDTSSAIKSFAMGNIDIKDSSITYVAAGQTTKADQITLAVKGADARSPLSVNGSLRYRAKTVKLDAEIKALSDFLAAKSSPATMALDGPDATLKFNGNAAMGDSMAANGKLSLAITNVPELLNWASGTKPAGKLPNKISIDAMVSASGKTYGMKNATVKVDDMTATGDLAANLGGAIPSIAGTLNFATLDFDKMFASADAPRGPGLFDAYAAEAAGWSNDPIDFSGLKTINADLHLNASAMKYAKMNIGATALHTVINGGALTTTIEKAALYGGNVSGTVSASAAQTVGVNLTLTGVQIEPLLTDLSGSSRIKGTTDLKLNLNGRGASERAIVSALAGSGSFSVKNGAIKGVDLAGFWRNAQKGFLFKNSGESTDFSSLNGTFTVAQGIVTNKDLAMQSPFLRVAGQGTANLPSQTLDYRLTPTIVSSTQGQGGKAQSGLEVPLNITGPWSNPNVIPDVASMVKQQLQNPQNLKNLGNVLKNNNSPKDIGNTLKKALKF